MIIRAIKTGLFREKSSLESFIFKHIENLQENSLVVITSKVVALAQGRTAAYHSEEDKNRLIEKESQNFIKTKWCYLTLKDGHWCPNAGIDESNADGKLILWPVDPYGVAEHLRQVLQKRYKVKNLGILITDSRIFPLRSGVTGVALGYAGFKGLRNYIGKPDIFGRKLKMTKTNLADGLATAAVLAMGEGNEQKPLVVIEAAPIEFSSEKTNRRDLYIKPEDDLYVPLFQGLASVDDSDHHTEDYTDIPQEMQMAKGTFAAKLFRRLAHRAGVVVNVEPWGFAGQIVFPDGVKRYFRTTNYDLNTLGASELAKDKDYANYFMAKAGYPVVPGKAFYNRAWARAIGSKQTPEAALRYAKKLGFPVIVKPNSLSFGVGVEKVLNSTEFVKAVRRISKLDRVFLVQRVVRGRDYRIVVLDGKVISSYERLPLLVVGDGRLTISGLLERKQRAFKRAGRDTVINAADPRITKCLRRLGMKRSSVPAKGQTVMLLDNRNLSSGGEPVDVSGTIHPSYKRLAIRLTKDMGLRFCGVDLMVSDDISKPAGRYWVLEVNSAPGIDNYASAGKKQRQIVEKMYVQVIKAMH